MKKAVYSGFTVANPPTAQAGQEYTTMTETMTGLLPFPVSTGTADPPGSSRDVLDDILRQGGSPVTEAAPYLSAKSPRPCILRKARHPHQCELPGSE